MNLQLLTQTRKCKLKEIKFWLKIEFLKIKKTKNELILKWTPSFFMFFILIFYLLILIKSNSPLI